METPITSARIIRMHSKCSEKELAFARSYPDMAFEVHLSEMNLGETFLLMNQTDSAAFYLAKCEDFFRSIGNISALYYLDTQTDRTGTKTE